MSRSSRTAWSVLIALLAAILLPLVASAHEHRDVGKYEFVVGFKNEPAFEGEQNGVYVEITEKASGRPVENLAETLKAQVIFGDQQRDLALQPAWGEKGVYTSDFYPTSAGDYTFRFTGEIEGTAIDEKFTSSPDGFDSVKATSALQFPASVPTANEVAVQLAAAQSTARTATILGGAGLALGIVSTIAALLALRGRRSATETREATVART